MIKIRFSQFLPRQRSKKFPALLLYVLLFILGITCGYIAYIAHQGADSTENDQEAPIPPKVVAKQSIQTVKPIAPVDIASIYPFILPDGADVLTAASGARQGMGTAAPMAASTSLPAIPNYQPRPEGLPLPSIPVIPGNGPVVASGSSMQGPGSYSSTAIQGIFTGNSGSNMAILSDGKVVKEGDAYGGSRIAVIGGDGIQLDNGNSISYGIGIRKGE